MIGQGFWNWLSGKKTAIAMCFDFLYAGLAAIGYTIPALHTASIWLGAIGVGHKIVRYMDGEGKPAPQQTEVSKPPVK